MCQSLHIGDMKSNLKIVSVVEKIITCSRWIIPFGPQMIDCEKWRVVGRTEA